MEKKGNTAVVTDSDQAVWNAHVEETLKMAAKCEKIWREKMKREKTERELSESREAQTENQQFSADQAPVPSRFWSWRCTGHTPAQRWRIRRRTRLNGGIFHRLITS